MKKKAVTKNPTTMKLMPTVNTTNMARKKREANTVTRNSTRRDQRQLATTRKPTRMNTTKNTNSTMTNMRKANIR